MQKNKESEEIDKVYSAINFGANDKEQIIISMEELNKIIDEKVEEKLKKKDEGIVGVSKDMILLTSVNENKNVGTLALNSFTNAFRDIYSKYFEYNAQNGELICKEDGWYLFRTRVYMNSWNQTSKNYSYTSLSVSLNQACICQSEWTYSYDKL